MIKSFRFLLQFTWVNLGAVIGFAAIVVAGCYATGVPDNPGTRNLFETYYVMFPTMILLCLFLYAFALCTNNLNLGLSMGARRRDFFWALQGNLVFYAAVCWVLQMFMSAFPAVANWEVRDRWSLLSTYSGKLWSFPLLCIVLMVLGCLSGLVMAKSKILGAILVTLSVFVMVGATMLMLLSTDTNLLHVLRNTQWTWLWTALPGIMLGVAVATFAGGELLIWRTIQRYVVR